MKERNWKTLTELIDIISILREKIKQWKRQGLIIGFVPTMGALHIGHESLIKKARNECDRVVVSIFVNQMQFGPNEDFEKYPRPVKTDIEICEKNLVDIIFIPSSQEMYPEKATGTEKSMTTVVPPSLYQDKLCGKSRIGHFNGVATVVLKLFNIVHPDKAYFGQKDAQQLIIIKKMVNDLNIPVEIIDCPIIRENNGLAYSSRNAYLSNEEKEKALNLSMILNKIKQDYNSGINSSEILLNNALSQVHPDIKIEYLEILDTETLCKIDILKPNTLIAIAAKIGNIRLIDNLLI